MCDQKWFIRTLDCNLFEQFYVVIFDNRDSGLSSKMEPNAEYSLYDLAADTLGLADALDLETFHLAGFSMGGKFCAFYNGGRRLSVVMIFKSHLP